MGKRDLLIVAGAVILAVVLAAGIFHGSALPTGSWGLSFRQEGTAPIGNAGTQQLKQYDAVYLGEPLTHRIVTVAGDIVMIPRNLLVPIGTSYNDLLEAVGHGEIPYKVLSGGPMMGIAQFDLSVPVTKGTNAVTILGKTNRKTVEVPHCIRCGKCIDVCPMHLMPVLMHQSVELGDVEEMKKRNLMDCIECGCCAYTCPATIPLVQSFRSGKQQIRDAAAPRPGAKT